ncbi:hypothetical protein ACSSVY_000505 [Roseovarius sp. MBR-51]
MSNLNDIPGIGPAIATGLAKIGIATTKQLSDSDVPTLSQVRGISEARAADFIAGAKKLSASPERTKDSPSKASKKTKLKAAEKSKPSKDKVKSKKASKAKKKNSKAAEGQKSKKDKVKKAKKPDPEKKAEKKSKKKK